MSVEDWRLAFEIVQAVVTVVLWLYVRGVNRHRATLEHIDNLEEEVSSRIDGHDKRLTRVEETIRHVPNGSDMIGVRDALSRLANQVAEMRGAQNSATRMVERINEYLMERGA